MRRWRNGRRGGLKRPLSERACGFDSHPPHRLSGTTPVLRPAPAAARDRGRRGEDSVRQVLVLCQLQHAQPGAFADQRAGGDVPGLDRALEVGVDSCPRPSSRVERGAAEAADVAHRVADRRASTSPAPRAPSRRRQGRSRPSPSPESPALGAAAARWARPCAASSLAGPSRVAVNSSSRLGSYTAPASVLRPRRARRRSRTTAGSRTGS